MYGGYFGVGSARFPCRLKSFYATLRLEAFLRRSIVLGVPRMTTDEDRDGYKIFRKICDNVVIFKGTHRFLDDALPQLLDIMRTEGGVRVPDDLRALVRAQVQCGPNDPRLAPEYAQKG